MAEKAKYAAQWGTNYGEKDKAWGAEKRAPWGDAQHDK